MDEGISKMFHFMTTVLMLLLGILMAILGASGISNAYLLNSATASLFPSDVSIS